MKYWVYKDSRILGPFDRDAFAGLPGVDSATLVSVGERAGTGDADWRPVSEVPDLAGLGLERASWAVIGEGDVPAVQGALDRLQIDAAGLVGDEDFPAGAEELFQDADMKKTFGDLLINKHADDQAELRRANDRAARLAAQVEELHKRLNDLENSRAELMHRLAEQEERARAQASAPAPAAPAPAVPRLPPPPAALPPLAAAPGAPAGIPPAATPPPPPALPPVAAAAAPEAGAALPPPPPIEPPAAAPGLPDIPTLPPSAAAPPPPASGWGLPEGVPGLPTLGAAAPDAGLPPPPAIEPPAELPGAPAAGAPAAGAPASEAPAPGKIVFARKSFRVVPTRKSFKVVGDASDAASASAPSTDGGTVLQPSLPPAPALPPAQALPPAPVSLAPPAPSLPPAVHAPPPAAGPVSLAPAPAEPPPAAGPAAPSVPPPATMTFAAPFSPAPSPSPEPAPPAPAGPPPSPFDDLIATPAPGASSEAGAPPATLMVSGGASAPPPAPALPGAPSADDVLARLAKPSEAPPTAPPAPRPRSKKPFIIAGVLLVLVMAAVAIMFKSPKDVQDMATLDDGRGHIGTEGVDTGAVAAPPPAPEAAPAPAPAPVPEPAAPQADTAAPLNAAVELVKGFPLDGDRGTVGAWLQYSYTANPDAGREEWSASAKGEEAYLVEYKFIPAAGSANAGISLLFEADMPRRLVIAKSPEARQLLAGAPPPVEEAPKPKSRPKQRKKVPTQKPRPRPVVEEPKEVPLLPLPGDGELRPPAEDDGAFGSDTVNGGGI